MPKTINHPADAILDAAIPHVAFDGWSAATLRAAASDAGLDQAAADAAFPRGAVDLALAFHRRGDDDMVEALKKAGLGDLKVREKITTAVRTRLEVIGDKEAVRRGTTLFALPQHAADGAKAIWGTADAIWTAIGDTSDDINWYTKRATLSGVYASTVLFWLGDTSDGDTATWDFLDRRIEDVMRFEKFKAQANDNALFRAAMTGPNWLMSFVKAPPKMPRGDFPGFWNQAPQQDG